jgi:hypothetical protein
MGAVHPDAISYCVGKKQFLRTTFVSMWPALIVVMLVILFGNILPTVAHQVDLEFKFFPHLGESITELIQGGNLNCANCTHGFA